MKAYDEICALLKDWQYKFDKDKKINAFFNHDIGSGINKNYKEREYFSIFTNRFWTIKDLRYAHGASTQIIKKSLEDLLKYNSLSELKEIIINQDFEKASTSKFFPLERFVFYREYPKPTFNLNKLEYLSEDEIDIFKENFTKDSFKYYYNVKHFSCVSWIIAYRSLEKTIKKKELEYKNIFELKLEEYNNAKNLFENNKKKDLKKFEEFISEYSLDNPQSIVDRVFFIRNLTYMPNIFKKDFNADYSSNKNTLNIELEIPDVKQFPKFKLVKNPNAFKSLSGTKNKIRDILEPPKTQPLYTEGKLTNNEFDNMCEFITYAIPIRTIYEIVKFDELNAFKNIALTVWANILNSTTGLEEKHNILSIDVETSAIKKINLERINPKDCFYAFGGKDLSKTKVLDSLIEVASSIVIEKKSISEWKKEDDKKLFEYYNKGIAIDDLAKIFEKKPSEINSRINKLTEEK